MTSHTPLPRILIVDDVVENIALLGEALDGLAEVQFATSGPEGLSLARRSPPSLILLDIMMPGVDGFEVCAALKADAALQDIPVIFVTAKTGSETEARALEVGGVDFIEKPIHAEVARRRVALHLLLRQREADLRRFNEALESTVAQRTAALQDQTRELEALVQELSTKTTVLDKAPFAVLVLDPHARSLPIEYVNEAMCSLTGHAHEDLIGRSPRFLSGPLTSVDSLGEIGAVIRKAGRGEGELVIYRKDGQTRLVRWLAYPSHGAQQQLLKMIICLTDITDFRESQLTRKRLEAELQESTRLEFLNLTIAGMAHDLNTPIGIAVTASSHAAQTSRQLLAALETQTPSVEELRRLGSGMHRSAELISKNLTKAAELVNGFKKTTADVTHRAWRRVDLRELLESLRITMSPVMRRAQCTVELECPSPLHWHTEPAAIAQALTNLMVNATLHAFEGRQDRRLRIEVSEHADSVRIRVADNGNGMSEEAAVKAFTPFFTTRRAAGGSGLGLFSCRRAIEQVLGGHVELQTRSGQGTSFLIELPRRERPPLGESPVEG